MDKKQYKLLLEVLRRFQDNGILKSIILVGSWCIPLYKQYFKGLKNVSILRTRDMDFLVPLDAKFKQHVDVINLLKDLDFKKEFVGQEGYIRLIHAYLTLEFLVPEKGRGSDKPYKLPELGLNAQRLRFMDMLIEDTIRVDIEEVKVIIPHPVNFALHKLLICSRRSGLNKKEKSDKDKRVALQILNSLIRSNQIAPIRGIFGALHKNRQKEIMKILKNEGEAEMLAILK